MSDDLNEFVDAFLEESREELEDIDALLLSLKEKAEAKVFDEEAVNTIFRTFHTIKGTAAFLEFREIEVLAHEAETLLMEYRDKKKYFSLDFIDFIFKIADFFRLLMEKVEETSKDNGLEEERKELIDEIEDQLKIFSYSKELPQSKEEDPSLDLLQMTLTPEMKQSFISEADELLEGVEQALLNIRRDPESLAEHVGECFRFMHSFKGNCGLFNLTDTETLAHRIETILGDFKEGKLPASTQSVDELLSSLDVLRNSVSEFSEKDVAKIENLEDLLVTLDKLRDSDPEEEAKKGFGKLGEILVARGDVAPDLVEEAVRRQNLPLGEILVEMGAASPEAVKEAVTAQETCETTAKKVRKKIKRQDIRVDISKLDNLMNLVGELVIAQIMVSNHKDLQGLELRDFEKAAHHLNRITLDLQDVSMSIRMVPVGQAFKKINRLVHDTARKAEKKIRLEISGEDTEVDKTVLELISDPLVHLVRNAVDHGIDAVEERRRLGKSETGLIRLSARQESGEVLISVEDDGRGLDREKILIKALERSLLSEEEAQEMSDQEVFSLIFEPGFSTAEKVTDISGRGVGMDVVKKNIAQLNGHIDVESTLEKGTIFTVRIPLTLAIVEGMIVRVGNTKYIIPILSAHESIVPTPEIISRTMSGEELLEVHGKFISILRLHEIFGKFSEKRKLTEGFLVVVKAHGKSLALFVDEILGQHQTVIKSLSRYLGDLPGISGCTILSDGEVCLILDIKSLQKLLQKTNQNEKMLL
jgi:two-component system chemotaxis sensor kinase CheA